MQQEKSILSKNIEKRKADLGIKTNQALSQISGVSRAVITNVIKYPNKSLMMESGIALAKALDCRVEWLFSGEGPINMDDVLEAAYLRDGAPVVSLAELSQQTPEELIRKLYDDKYRERRPCPSGNSPTKFVVRSVDPLLEYRAGSLYFFDYERAPSNSDLVLVKLMNSPHAAPDIMQFNRLHDETYVKALGKDIPQDLAFRRITDEIRIIATINAVSIIS